MRSMTAYSRASTCCFLGSIVVEIHSVNRKGLDMTLHLPKDLLRFDIQIRKWLAGSIDRGQLTFRLNIQNDGDQRTLLSSYLKPLQGLKAGWQKLCSELGYDPEKTIDLPFLFSQLQMAPTCLMQEEDESFQKLLQQITEKALQDLDRMKIEEGRALSLDVQKRLGLIEEHLASIELKKGEVLGYHRNKLVDRLKEVGRAQEDIAERLVREVAFLTEKMDITEELVRLRAHVEQFFQHLASSKRAIGRTLDFLTQEMYREINTLGAKSADSGISMSVVQMKSELDKIREQVQNIE